MSGKMSFMSGWAFGIGVGFGLPMGTILFQLTAGFIFG